VRLAHGDLERYRTCDRATTAGLGIARTEAGYFVLASGKEQEPLNPGDFLVDCSGEYLWKIRVGENGKMLCSHVSLLARFIWLASGEC
jgi:hypothetical protein